MKIAIELSGEVEFAGLENRIGSASISEDQRLKLRIVLIPSLMRRLVFKRDQRGSAFHPELTADYADQRG